MNKIRFPWLPCRKSVDPRNRGGGAGIRQLSLMNLAMGAKLIWAMCSGGDKKWVRILKNKYLGSVEPKRILTTLNPPKGSIIWNYILECMDIINSHVTWEIGNKQNTSFWNDSWGGGEILSSLPNLNEIKEETSRLRGSKVSNF